MRETERWSVFDCFCGGGLFSFGARAAGMNVVLGIDNCPNALQVYKRNNPRATVECATLGPGRTEAVLPSPRPQLHAHLSPPCQELSNAKAKARSDEGLSMLRWSVRVGAQY